MKILLTLLNQLEQAHLIIKLRNKLHPEMECLLGIVTSQRKVKMEKVKVPHQMAAT
jgi:hypothetical protein